MKPLIHGMRRLMRRGTAVKYRRRPPLVLINGLAEQQESWFCNVDTWRRRFDVHTPNILAYEAAGIHRRIEEKLPIDIDYLVEQLRVYLDSFVQSPPYALVANSMGGKIAVEFCARYPEQVSRLALLAPSGLGEKEQLPIIEGVRRGNSDAVVHSVFHKPVGLNPAITDYFRDQFANRRWRQGMLRTVQGTKKHSIRRRLAELKQPTLLVVGGEDRIIDPQEAVSAGKGLPHVRTVVIPNCGHAPQIERASLVNRLVVDFLTEAEPVSTESEPRESESSHSERPAQKNSRRLPR
jgi:pimeloyl-ACP methyl ester carboxylesterase